MIIIKTVELFINPFWVVYSWICLFIFFVAMGHSVFRFN